MISETQLRSTVMVMSKNEMISLRDQIESNWTNSLRPLMNILSLGCIKKFNTTISKL